MKALSNGNKKTYTNKLNKETESSFWKAYWLVTCEQGCLNVWLQICCFAKEWVDQIWLVSVATGWCSFISTKVHIALLLGLLKTVLPLNISLKYISWAFGCGYSKQALDWKGSNVA